MCGDDDNFACDISQCSTTNTFKISAPGTIQLNAAVESALGNITAATATAEVTSTVTGSRSTVTVTSQAGPEAKGGLSAGAGAGIGVGIGVPLLTASVLLGMMFLRERKTRQKYSQLLDEARSSGAGEPPHAIPVSFESTQMGGAYKDTPARSELAADSGRHELQSYTN